MEPTCFYCNASDKFRCRTQEQATTCPTYIENQRIFNLAFPDGFDASNAISTRKPWNLFLDDERFPSDSDNKEWKIARNFDEAAELMETFGCPIFVSFDHDLGEDGLTGFDLVKYMVRYDMDNPGFIPFDFTFYVHSQNPVGANNIRSYLTNYLRVK